MAQFGIRHDVLRDSRSTLIFGVLRSCIPARPRKLSATDHRAKEIIFIAITLHRPSPVIHISIGRHVTHFPHLSEISLNGLFPRAMKNLLTAFVGLQFRLEEIKTLINT